MPVTNERKGEALYATLEYLAEHGSSPVQDVETYISETIHPTPEESQPRGHGWPEWAYRNRWTSTQMVHAGFITKDGSGVWDITDDGRAAFQRNQSPAALFATIRAGEKAWRAAHKPAQRRAWLVRGSSVQGVNVVHDWLTHEYCSLAAAQLREIAHDISPDELRAVAAEDYAHLSQHEQKAKVGEILAFATKMHVGDILLTTSDEHVYVGDVTGDWTYEMSEGGRSNLRRAVDWRNEDVPFDLAELPAPLPARLQTGNTIRDLTADLALIDGLLDGNDDDGETTGKGAPRHERLREPSQSLADDLFVDFAWLVEVRDLLNERRQVVFFGPPGTGKTYIARKLAADLVGSEQVKLVQFHPAYTYEDFFEGYRPVPGASDGTISFELKPGPLRQLVNRAREHPEQAFVLIIDEINRANLAKVFGELYFLLEYRDQAVELLYSADDEGFTLPTNLYVIGTMNTADRSIALIDGAMRRRFAFVALDPDTEPTRSLLAKWSNHHGLGSTGAALLAELNRRIEDPDFHIGPSYFMNRNAPDAHSPERLERIWRTSILPLLQEHHYGEWESMRRRYDLASLLAAVGPAPVPETDSAPSAAPAAEVESGEAT